jgi:hypothetical protein
MACGDDTSGTGGGGGGGGTGGDDPTTTTSSNGGGGMGGGAGGEGGGASANAQVRVAHLSPDAPPVDVCVLSPSDMVIAGPVLKGLGDTDGLAYPDATGYVELPPGSYKFRIVAPNADDCNTALAGLPDVGPLALAEGGAYTAAAVGSLDPSGNAQAFEVIALEDNLGAPAAGNAHLRFVHAASDVPAVDVGTVADGTVTDVWTNIAYKSAGAYTPVPGPFTANVGAALNADPSSTAAIAFTNINIPAGAIVDVFAIGLLGGSDGQELGALACVVGGECFELDPLPN